MLAAAIRPKNSPGGSGRAAPDAGRLHRNRRDRRFFPGETESDFRTTYEFLERLAPAYLHIFPFSRSVPAPAVDFPDKESAAFGGYTARGSWKKLFAADCTANSGARAEGTTIMLFESTTWAG